MQNVEKYRAAPKPFVDRTLMRYEVADNDCWLWAGSLTRDGYGQANYKVNGRQFAVYVHVLAYQAWCDALIDGYQIDHACHDPSTCGALNDCSHRRCVNPDHLVQMLPWDNAKRSSSPIAANVSKTTCPQGHPYDGTDGSARRCSICRGEDKRRDYARNGAQANARRIEKMQADPAYRERRLAAQRARSASEANKAARRDRYANDAEYRERIKAAVAARHEAKKSR